MIDFRVVFKTSFGNRPLISDSFGKCGAANKYAKSLNGKYALLLSMYKKEESIT